MDTFEYDGICIKSINYKENDKIITLYCGDKGKITVLAKGCRSAKAKLKFAVSPFCFGKYNLAYKAGRYTLVGCDCYDCFFDLTSNIDNYYGACVVLEFLDKMSVEGEYEHQLFILSLNAIKDLCYSQKQVKQLIYEYLMQATKILGYYLNAIRLVDIHRFYKDNNNCNLVSLRNLIDLN